MTSDVLPPYFPATAPEVFTGPPDGVLSLLEPVLSDLAVVVGGSAAADAGGPTPCAEFDVGALRDHIVGWLEFFAAALADPDARDPRPQPEAYRAAEDKRAAPDVVRRSAQTIKRAVRAGATRRQVVLTASRMDGSAAIAMILGEYLVHGWDLARATDRPWAPSSAACEAALGFFRGMILPEYRGGDGGYFGAEVPVAADAGALERLLGFAGRDPGWRPNG